LVSFFPQKGFFFNKRIWEISENFALLKEMTYAAQSGYHQYEDVKKKVAIIPRKI
jgi:hypothetical protein